MATVSISISVSTSTGSMTVDPSMAFASERWHSPDVTMAKSIPFPGAQRLSFSSVDRAGHCQYA